MIEKISKTFQEKFNQKPIVVRSPGRVNIIGEHTDYNEGFVLPAAIDKAIYIAIAKNNSDTINLFAVDFDEHYSTSVESIKPKKNHWSNYILGVVDQLQKRNIKINGFNAVLDGDIPIGAGLSSSAAVECATGFALNELFNLNLTKLEMVQMAQMAEQQFVGLQCGIMDMFASMFGKANHVIQLDCRSLEYKYEPLQLDGIKIVLLNTNVKHSLSSSEYNVRRQQCEQGVEWIRQHHQHVKTLRDVNMQMLDDYVLPKDKLIYNRCKFIVGEIERLLKACEDLETGDIKALGKKMFITHEGLSKDYEVSCKELDFLVDQVKNNESVLGARMMGGGFGGCTINLVKEDAIDGLINDIKKEYEAAMHLPLTAYVAQIEDGTSLMKD